MAVTNYPTSLQPKQHSEILVIDTSGKDSEKILVRRSLLDGEDSFDNLKLLKTRALVSNLKEIFGLSLNLMDGNFQSGYIKYISKKPASDPWLAGSEVYPIEVIEQNTDEVKSTPIYFIIKDIAPLNFPFEKKYDRTSIKKIKALPEGLALNIDTTNNTATFNSSSDILSKPNHANFWHVEFHIYDESFTPKKIILKGESADPEMQITSSANWKVAVAHHFFNVLKAKAKEVI